MQDYGKVQETINKVEKDRLSKKVSLKQEDTKQKSKEKGNELGMSIHTCNYSVGMLHKDQEFEASLDSFYQTNKSKIIKNEKVRGKKRGIREELLGKTIDDNKDLLKLCNTQEVV